MCKIVVTLDLRSRRSVISIIWVILKLFQHKIKASIKSKLSRYDIESKECKIRKY